MESAAIWPLIIATGVIAYLIWLPVRILRKAGYSGWWVLVGAVPVVNVVMVWVFAFADWPRLRTASPQAAEASPHPHPKPSPRAAPAQRKSPHYRRL
jgi:predicted PurR-regulated permease PerM